LQHAFASQLSSPRDWTINHAISERPAIKLEYIMTARCALAQVYALLDRYGTGKPEVLPVVNVTQPNGLAWLNGSLFIAQPDAILQYAGADDAVLAGRVSSSACNFALIYCSSQVLMGQ